MRPRSSPPPWFVGLVTLAVCLLVRALDALVHGHPIGVSDAAPVSMAFWAAIVAIAGWVWRGLEVAGRVTLSALSWSVNVLWAFARTAYNAAVAAGKGLVTGFRKSWDFLQATYTHVLKPAWQHFWKWIDTAKRWLEQLFGPVLRFLRTIRDEILKFYDKWIRPILDTIDIARKALRVLQALGVDWARKLDAELAKFQQAIERPFRELLAKVNEIVNLVNRVVTLDGLFQRLALIRSIERDIGYVVNTWHNSQSVPLTAEERRAALLRGEYKTGEEIIRETQRYLDTGDGPRSETIDEWSTSLAIRLGVR
jgi:hypothetical protein